MTEILISKNSVKETVETSTPNNREEGVIELKFVNDSISSTTRNFLWERKKALSSIRIEKALAYSEIGMGLGANMMVFQFF